MKNNWDDVFSTYYWKIELDRSNSKNTMPIMTGYCKAVGSMESPNKHHLMKRLVAMLINKGYIPENIKTEMYHRSGKMINPGNDWLVAEFLPDDFIVYDCYPYDTPDLIIALKKMYGEKKKGIPVSYNMDRSNKPNVLVSKDDAINYQKQMFYKFNDLLLYTVKLESEGFPKQAISAFYRQMILKMERAHVKI